MCVCVCVVCVCVHNSSHLYSCIYRVLIAMFSSQWLPQMKMMTVHPNSNTMTYIINPHYQNLSKIFSNSLTIARNTPESGALQIHSDLQLHPATVDMLLEENATIPYSSMGHGTSVRPHHKNYQHCQPVAVPCSFRYTDVYISADSNSSCASNKSKIKLCYNQESLLLQHSFSPWLLVDVDTADEIPCKHNKMDGHCPEHHHDKCS